MKPARAAARLALPDDAREFARQSAGGCKPGAERAQLPPENRLPVLLRSAFPIENHARPKGEIAVERSWRSCPRAGNGAAPGEADRGSGADRQTRPGSECRKQLHDAPGQIFAHKSERPPGRATLCRSVRRRIRCGKGKRDIGANSLTDRELLSKPALHTEGLHHDRLRRNGSRSGGSQHNGERIGQELEAIADVKMEAGGSRSRSRTISQRSDKGCPTKWFFFVRIKLLGPSVTPL